MDFFLCQCCMCVTAYSKQKIRVMVAHWRSPPILIYDDPNHGNVLFYFFNHDNHDFSSRPRRKSSLVTLIIIYRLFNLHYYSIIWRASNKPVYELSRILMLQSYEHFEKKIVQGLKYYKLQNIKYRTYFFNF